MKQKDIALLIIIIALSLGISYLVGNSLINTPENRQTEVEVVSEFEVTFPSPNEDPISETADVLYNEVFSKGYVNPTETIKIGPGKNPDPFQSTSQQ